MRFLSITASRAALVLVLVPALAACGDDVENGDDPSPTSAATAALTVANGDGDDTPTTEPAVEPTTEPTAEPTLEPSPTPSPAFEIATGPQHFLYAVSDGDTLASIAAYFDAEPGEGGFLDGDELGDLNGVDDGALEPGMLLAIPVRLPAVEAIMPENTIEEALGIGAGDPILLLQPTREMIDGFLGVIALYRVTLVPSEGGESAGYVMEYWFTDRPGFRAGEIDPDAVFSEPAFTLAAGSLAGTEIADAADSEPFERSGVDYVFSTYSATDMAPADLVALLGTAGERNQ